MSSATLARPVPVFTECTVLENSHITDRYWRLRLEAPTIAERAQVGQFVMLTVARDTELDPLLPRPMALYDWDRATGEIEILYGVVGHGTRHLSGFRSGEPIRVVGPLGQGFALDGLAGNRVLVVGRGIGTCSLLSAAAAAAADGSDVFAVESARHSGALFAAPSYRSKGISELLHVHDADGSSDPLSIERTLHDRLDDEPPALIITCGSQRLIDMCASLARGWGSRLQISVEAHMACGLGYCHGCSSGTQSNGLEEPLVCRDGPVFDYDLAAGRYVLIGSTTPSDPAEV